MNLRYKYINYVKPEHQNVLYLMTKTFRVKNNYSLYEAMQQANKLQSALSVWIVRPQEENPRNRVFFTCNTKDLEDVLSTHSNSVRRVETDFELSNIQWVGYVYMDKAYLKSDLEFFLKVTRYCKEHSINLIEVDSNVFVPTEIASDKEEYSARTIRKKITDKLLEFEDTVLEDAVGCTGERNALKQLNDFIETKLNHYDNRNDPSIDYLSGLSPYLKYGLLSPVTIYETMKNLKSEAKDVFLEELIVRRELAYNFVLYNKDYDQFHHMTYDWAYRSMKEHANDTREYIYTIDDYINANTHDVYFNTAMKEMISLGKMHSYMRMYWCKKIIEWSKTHEEAYDIAIHLNNTYFLDGNTPNGYAGVAWCFGKHDRAWSSRNIFGKLRYMNSNGLVRKFDMDNYIKRIELEIEKGENI